MKLPLRRTKAPLDTAKPVKVYWNLHRKCFSIQQKGLVVAHADMVKLSDVTFKISEAGRQRVIKEQRKNVHAYMIGTLTDELFRIGSSHALTYNPYKVGAFVIRHSTWSSQFITNKVGDEVHTAKDAVAVVNKMLDGTARSSIRVHLNT